MKCHLGTGSVWRVVQNSPDSEVNSPDTIDNILKTHDMFFSKYYINIWDKYKCTRNVKMCIINQFGWVQLYHLLTQECLLVGCVPTTAVAATRCHYGWGGLPNSPSWGRLAGYAQPPPLGCSPPEADPGGSTQPPGYKPPPPGSRPPLPSGWRASGYRTHGCRAPSPLWTEWHTLLKTLPSLALGINVSQFQNWRL